MFLPYCRSALILSLLTIDSPIDNIIFPVQLPLSWNNLRSDIQGNWLHHGLKWSDGGEFVEEYFSLTSPYAQRERSDHYSEYWYISSIYHEGKFYSQLNSCIYGCWLVHEEYCSPFPFSLKTEFSRVHFAWTKERWPCTPDIKGTQPLTYISFTLSRCKGSPNVMSQRN